MPENEKIKIADSADMIVGGYIIQKFIKKHYKEMYEKWSEDSDNGYYGGGCE